MAECEEYMANLSSVPYVNPPEVIPTTVFMVYMIGGGELTNAAIQSLQQLQSSASDDVVAVVQYDLDGDDGPRHIHRVKFDSSTRNKKFYQCQTKIQPQKHGMIDTATLEEFITQVVEEFDQATNFVLFFWADAFVLRGGAPTEAHQKGTKRPYLTPVEIGKALSNADEDLKKSGKARSGKKVVDLIALDACCMSTVEVAWELRECTDFLVASEKEVPDPGFQYDSVLKLFQEKSELTEICATLPKIYRRYYEEWVCTPHTGIQRVALSSIDLRKLDALTDGLKNLSTALLAVPPDSTVIPAIVFSARAQCKGSVAGLCVDIHEICCTLRKELEAAGIFDDLSKACNDICKALEDKSFIIANERDAQDCSYHGLLCYWPYLTDNDRKELEESAKFQPTEERGGLIVPVRGAFVDEMRKVLIRDIEAYYPGLVFSRSTQWGRFIRAVWPVWLAEKEPVNLDFRYSALQCAKNLVALVQQYRKPATAPDPPPPPPPSSGVAQKIEIDQLAAVGATAAVSK